MNQFPEITVSGTAYQRGYKHGTQLKAQIAQSLEFYRSIFAMPDEEILQHATIFRSAIESFSTDYFEELEGIAQAAGVDPLWVVALNARTEILSQRNVVTNECTSLYFQETSILGQNWDWGRALEPLTVLMKVEQPDGHIICMITEPGIIGKIGVNNSGVGVCLNILNADEPCNGLPVHIVLRALLDCKSMAEVDIVLDRHAAGKASNIIVADKNGNGFDLELCGDRQFRLTPESGYLLHTNHYLGERINSPDNPDFFSSFARFNTATEWLQKNTDRSVAAMCRLLSDDSHTELPIYREYVPEKTVRELGTICTIVMDLNTQTILLRKGKEAGAQFYEYNFN